MQTWRGWLKEGDYVDTLMEQDEIQVGWATANIKSITEDNLMIELDTRPGEFLQVERWSNKLALFKSQTSKMHMWKSENLVGCKMTEIDAFDGSHWYKSTVLSTREEKTIDKIIIYAHVAY